MGRYVAIAAAVLALVGCVRTIHPLYTEDDLAFDPALVGTWESADDGQQEKWVFRKKGEKSYTLVHTDQNGRKGRLQAHLLEIEGHRFMDLTPQKMKDENHVYRLTTQRVHTFLKVKGIEPRLRLVPMNPKWLKNYLEEHPEALDYENPEDAPAVLTSSSEELQGFVLKHRTTDKAWGTPVELQQVQKDE